MVCKKCDSDYKLYIQKIQHDEQMERLCEQFLRLRRDMAYFQFSMTGDRKYMDECEFKLKNGGW
jgi:hypothetical protein